MSAKTRSGETTRATILAIARAQFGEHGFERTTIRSIASAAGVDPALVMHYFGNKAELFAAASHLDFAFPDLSDVEPTRVVDALLPVFFELWGSRGPLLPLLRAAASNPAAAEALRAAFVERVAPGLVAVVPDRAGERAALLGAQLLGVAVVRHIVGEHCLADMDDATLTEWLRPVLAHYLSDPAPGASD